MWLRIIICLIIISAIDDHWESKIKKQCIKKRKYRFLKSFTYFTMAMLLFLLAVNAGREFYVYVALNILIGIGTFLSAINSNLRELYMAVLVFGTIMGIALLYYNEHKVICILVVLWMTLSIIEAIKESIYNMRHGIDPDIIAEQKAAKKG